jgi:hypothetical protein
MFQPRKMKPSRSLTALMVVFLIGLSCSIGYAVSEIQEANKIGVLTIKK